MSLPMADGILARGAQAVHRTKSVLAKRFERHSNDRPDRNRYLRGSDVNDLLDCFIYFLEARWDDLETSR